MPSPIAHAVSGYVLAKGLEPAKVCKLWPLAAYAVFVAIAADFDFIPQVLTGIQTHRGFTHSLSFALIFSIVISALATRSSLFRAFHYGRLCALTLLLYGSHLVLDFFTNGSGIPLLWPISEMRVQSAITIFPAVRHSLGLFAPIHLLFLGFELTYTALLLWGLARWGSYQQQRQASTHMDL